MSPLLAPGAKRRDKKPTPQDPARGAAQSQNQVASCPPVAARFHRVWGRPHMRPRGRRSTWPRWAEERRRWTALGMEHEQSQDSVTGRTPDRRHHGPKDHPDGSKIRARFLSRPGLLQGVWLAWVQRGPQSLGKAAATGSLVLRLGGRLGACADKSQVRLMQTSCLGKVVKVGWCCHLRALCAGRDELCRLSSGT